MSWLSKVTNEMIPNLAPPVFAPSVMFDFEDVREAVEMVEASIITKQEKTQIQRREAAMKAAADPYHSFVKDPVSVPMGQALWKAALTFPRILRGALLISIASHVEHVLGRWCDLLHREWSLPRNAGKAPRGTPEVLHCMNYLRDVAGLAVGGFEQWDQWKDIEAYKTARDCLAHKGGTVSQEVDRATIGRLLKVKVETSGLLAEEPTIFIDAGACEAAAETARGFFARLGEICQQDPRAAKPGAVT